jgi:hypothetical protein
LRQDAPVSEAGGEELGEVVDVAWGAHRLWHISPDLGADGDIC